MWGSEHAVRRCGALFTIGLLGACSGGSSPASVSSEESDGGEEVSRGEIVAKLEMIAPEEEIFFVRGTVPVPPGTFLPGQEELPLAVVTWPGTTAPTQIEQVTAYPNPADGASVVEVIARIRRPPTLAPGERMPLFVVAQPHDKGKMLLSGHVRKLLEEPGALHLSTSDVFGNAYETDLFRQVVTKHDFARMTKSGALLKEYAVHEVLRPVEDVNGAQGTLDHMMGVHAYIQTFDRADWFLLDLHVHNGMDGLDPTTADDTAMDELFFKDLKLRLPQGWRAEVLFDHTSLGNGSTANGHWTLPLVKAMAGGKLHSLPKQGRFVRRLAIWTKDGRAAAEAMLRGENLAYARPGLAPSGERLWSWWNADTARWLPQAHRLPDLSHLNHEVLVAQTLGQLDTYTQQLATGTGGGYPYKSNALGWAQPWGVPYGGMTGGDEVYLTRGLEPLEVACPEGYRLAQLMLRSYSDRQPTALFNVDGTATKMEDVLVEEGYGAPYVACSFYITPGSTGDPFGFNDAPMFQINAAVDQGLVPGYRDELGSYMPIDIQHYIRYTNNLKLVTWLSNDTLAKDQMVAAAEVFRLGFHEYPVGAYGYTPGTGLLTRMNHVAEFPGRGVDMSRAEGWGLDAAVSAYLVAGAGVRDDLYPWFQTIANLAEEGASTCTGNLMSSYVGSKVFDGKYRIRYLGHSSYADNALRGMQRSVFEGRNDAIAASIADTIVGNARALTQPPFFNEEAGLPYSYIGVGPVDVSLGEHCFNIPQDGLGPYFTNQKYYASLAYAYEETGDQIFLFRAAQMLGGGNLENRLLEAGMENIETWAALLATVQGTPEP